MLTERDELRHAHDERAQWRESIYFNWADPENEIGGWVYVWVLPNQRRRLGMLVALYHGVLARTDCIPLAMASRDNTHREPSGAWVYCRTTTVPHDLDVDFDDIELNGLHLRRIGPLEGYQFTYDGGEDLRFDLRYEFLNPPWDYATGPMRSPSWFADNRYHRSGATTGTIDLGGRRLNVVASGDSDHSWGRRDLDELCARDFKYWGVQHPELRASVISMRGRGDDVCLGFVERRGTISGVTAVRDEVDIEPDGVHRRVAVEVTDESGATFTARFAEPFAAIGFSRAADGSWGFETVGNYEIEGIGRTAGLATYGWPAHVMPAAQRRQPRS